MPRSRSSAHTQCSFYFLLCGRVQELTIWAYPTSAGFLEDKLICCIEKNPNPVVFSLCCHGVLVKLEVIPQELSFDKLLLHRSVLPQAIQTCDQMFDSGFWGRAGAAPDCIWW